MTSPAPAGAGPLAGQLPVNRLAATPPPTRTATGAQRNGSYRSIGTMSGVVAPPAPARKPEAPVPPTRRGRPGSGVGSSSGAVPTVGTGRGSSSGRHLLVREGATAGGSPSGTGPVRARSARVKSGRRRRPTFWRELPMLVVVALLLTVLIQTFLVRVYQIPSGSMEPTLHGCPGCTDDRVLVDKLSYRFGDPSPGDVVVFKAPPNWEDEDLAEPSSNPLIRGLQTVGSLIGLAPPSEEDVIKRVIAVGGQTVACCDAKNRVTVDGAPLNEPYINHKSRLRAPSFTEFGPVKVPEGQLWVMGDNRNNSADSRQPGHGSLPLGYVIGKARFVVLPVSRSQSIPDTNPQRVALAAPGGARAGAPLALGLVGAVPLTAGRRWWRSRRSRRGDHPVG